MASGYLAALAAMVAVVIGWSMVGLVLLSIIALSASVGQVYLFALAATAAWVSLMSFFMTYEPCGDMRDNVALIVVAAASLIGGIYGLAGKYVAALASAIGGWLFSTMATEPLGLSCKNEHKKLV